MTSISISATQIKQLREATGAGMMECKKALELAAGNFDRAIEELRKAGAAKAVRKAGRTAAEGVILVRVSADGKEAIIIEINCETDFVARDQNFSNFANAVADAALSAKAKDLSALNQLPLAGSSVSIEEARQALVAKIGENIHVRRVSYLTSPSSLGSYLHGARIGVLVSLDKENPELAKDIAMHIAASKPMVIAPEHVPQDMIDKEKEIYFAQAATSGKPQDIIEKMVGGRVKKYLDEVSLLGQPFIKDPNMTILNLLNKNNVKVLGFTRFEVGEGIEKEKEDFVGAVMSQIQGG